MSEKIDSSNRSVAGALYATSAFLIWGVSPIYWKTLRKIPALEIIMHRVVWSFLFLFLILLMQKRISEFIATIKNVRAFLTLCASTLIIASNWLIFVWAVNKGYVLQTSLGYYIAPLVNVFLGLVFLRERLRSLQIVAVTIAAAAVLYLSIDYGRFPWIAISLSITFGFYGLIRKVVPVRSLVGLTIETLILSGPALGYLYYLNQMGGGAFLRVGLRIDGLLMMSALFTGLPLFLFTLGARRLHLSTLGFLQYIAPSCFFLLAVFVFHETITLAQVWTFAFIWVALVIYSTDSVLYHRRIYTAASNGQ